MAFIMTIIIVLTTLFTASIGAYMKVYNMRRKEWRENE